MTAETCRSCGEVLDCQHCHPHKGMLERIAELEAVLREIGRPTYGVEIHDSDAELVVRCWAHLARYQKIAREALTPPVPSPGEAGRG